MWKILPILILPDQSCNVTILYVLFICNLGNALFEHYLELVDHVMRNKHWHHYLSVDTIEGVLVSDSPTHHILKPLVIEVIFVIHVHWYILGIGCSWLKLIGQYPLSEDNTFSIEIMQNVDCSVVDCTTATRNHSTDAHKIDGTGDNWFTFVSWFWHGHAVCQPSRITTLVQISTHCPPQISTHCTPQISIHCPRCTHLGYIH